MTADHLDARVAKQQPQRLAADVARGPQDSRPAYSGSELRTGCLSLGYFFLSTNLAFHSAGSIRN